MRKPADGDTIRQLCEQVAEEIDSLTDRSVSQIRAELSSYSVVPIEEQHRYISRQLAAMLRAVAENETLPDDVIERSRALGQRRAMQGLPLSDVIETYHIASRELWNAMVARSSEPTNDLLHAGGALWDLVHAATSAVAVGHTEATSSEQAIRAGMRYRFFDAVCRTADEESGEIRELGQALGFDPQREFRAVCVAAEHWSEAQVERLQRTLDAASGRTQSSRHGVRLIALSQSTPVEQVIRAISDDHPAACIGVGLARPGLAGAAMSIADADRGLRLASPTGEVVNFANEWLPATLADHRTELAALLESGAAIGAEHPHLVDAVLAFARNEFSVSAAGRDIHLHPNSVMYRLERWQHLTGWNPRSLDGLMQSVVSLALYSRGTPRRIGSPEPTPESHEHTT
jgi:hypothetical protein